TMHDGKTGALFAAPLKIARALGGIPTDSREGRSLDQLALRLGRAFQAADDLDDASQDGALPPKNILHFLSAEEIRRRSLEGLAEAKTSIQSIWGERSSGIMELVGSVEKALHDQPEPPKARANPPSKLEDLV